MNTNTLIEKMKKRMREILGTQLPPSALREYNQLQATIDVIQQVEQDKPICSAIPTKQRILEYLKNHGPSSPAKIAKSIGTNPGVVSQQLSMGKGLFVRIEKGVWGITGIDEPEEVNINATWKEEVPF